MLDPMPKLRTINATAFKAKCLGLLDEVREKHSEVIITKRGKPVARLVPIKNDFRFRRGDWKGGEIKGEIVHVDWSHLFEVLK